MKETLEIILLFLGILALAVFGIVLLAMLMLAIFSPFLAIMYFILQAI